MKRRIISFRGSTRTLRLLVDKELSEMTYHDVPFKKLINTDFYIKVESESSIYEYYLASSVTAQRLKGYEYNEVNGRAWLPMNLWPTIDSRMTRGGE